MILVLIEVFLIFQTIIGAPIENNILKKRELEGLLPLTDIISNVENSLIKEAHSAGSVQELGKLRIGRDIESDIQEFPKTQFSIITVKVNPSELESVKDLKISEESIKDNVKLNSLKNKQIKNLDDKKTEDNTTLQREEYKKKKGKKIVNTVAEIEVNPTIFASRY